MTVRNILYSLSLIGLMLLFAHNSTSAQPGPPSLEERMKNLKERLNLSQDQYDKIKKIHEDADKKRSKIFSEQNSDRDAMRTQMMNLRDDTDKKIEAVLKADQKAKFAEMKKERRSWGGRPQNVPKSDDK